MEEAGAGLFHIDSLFPNCHKFTVICICICDVMLCYVMLCYVTLCYVMLCYVMSCYFMLRYVMLSHIMISYGTASKYVVDLRANKNNYFLFVCRYCILRAHASQSPTLWGHQIQATRYRLIYQHKFSYLATETARWHRGAKPQQIIMIFIASDNHGGSHRDGAQDSVLRTALRPLQLLLVVRPLIT